MTAAKKVVKMLSAYQISTWWERETHWRYCMGRCRQTQAELWQLVGIRIRENSDPCLQLYWLLLFCNALHKLNQKSLLCWFWPV